MGIASLLELKYVAENFLNKETNINAQGEHYDNALQVASVRGHDQVMQMLLDKEIDINAKSEEYNNALQTAS